MKQRLLLLPAIASIIVLLLIFTGFPIADIRVQGPDRPMIPLMEFFGIGMGMFYFSALLLLAASVSTIAGVQANTKRRMNVVRKDIRLIRRSNTIILICGTGILLQTIIVYYLFWRVTTPVA